MLRLVSPDDVMTHADQLACDEAMLNLADRGRHRPALRLWQFNRPVVVLGRSSKHAEEVDWAFCERHGIPVLRRVSGGAAIVGGPGCLMYSVVLKLDDQGDLRKVDVAHRVVMGRVLQAARRQVPRVQRQGICDLTVDQKKFSGNSLRITRGHLLYHGTILHDSDLGLVAGALAAAPRQPEYRAGRDHDQFIMNLPCDPARLADDLAEAFGADDCEPVEPDDPQSELAQEMRMLKQSRYHLDAWHRRH